ncbi:MAG: YebC/PmpR family DNA-binding transcriptional regulator [Xanthomonadales bacterium]|nr:YebC/PmpR family DNA-binding transcriptional regulator [Xanthomonadales bacterium]
MAGHSKWANIQHRKKAQDKKRGKIFTKLIREITVAAREGGGDPDTNPRLRLAVDKANAANMPKENIERAIKKATGELEGVTYEEIRYEGYLGGVAVMVDCLTDNRNRTVAEVRHTFDKHGGSLGTEGSVAYMFEKRGIITFPPESDEDSIMLAALDAGADDIETDDDGSIEVLTSPDAYGSVRKGLLDAGLEPVDSELTMRPMNWVELDVETGRKVLEFLDVLDDLDDTQSVHSNADIPSESYAD